MWFARLIGIVPLGIGLTVLGFLWGMPFGDFGSPPLFFRIFGSFVALFFVLIGGAIVFGAHIASPERLAKMAQRMRDRQSDAAPPGSATAADPPPAAGYCCTQCGAPLGDDADVSPRGDVKCAHCGKWFNIHHA